MQEFVQLSACVANVTNICLLSYGVFIPVMMLASKHFREHVRKMWQEFGSFGKLQITLNAIITAWALVMLGVGVLALLMF